LLCGTFRSGSDAQGDFTVQNLKKVQAESEQPERPLDLCAGFDEFGAETDSSKTELKLGMLEAQACVGLIGYNCGFE
jgi:hypothetical protein